MGVEQASTIDTAADTSLLFGKNPPVIFLIKRKFLSKPFGEFGGLAKIIAWRLADTDLGGTLRRPGEKPFKGKLKTRFLAKPREIGRFGGQMEIILATTCSTKGRLGPHQRILNHRDNFHRGSISLSDRQQKKHKTIFMYHLQTQLHAQSPDVKSD